MITIIKILIDAAKLAFDSAGKAKAAKRERKDSAADFYLKIATTLEDVARTLNKGDYPDRSCQKVLVYAEGLPGAIGDVIGKDTAKKISAKLSEAHKVEQLYIELKNVDNKKEQLAELRRASGYFEAAADILKAS